MSIESNCDGKKFHSRLTDGSFSFEMKYLIAAAPEMYDFVHFFETVAGQVILLAAQKSGMKKEAHEIYEEAVRICKKARGEV